LGSVWPELDGSWSSLRDAYQSAPAHPFLSTIREKLREVGLHGSHPDSKVQLWPPACVIT